MKKIVAITLTGICLFAFSAMAQEGPQDLPAAIAAIQSMMAEVASADNSHKEAMKNLLFMRCYYTKRAGIPEGEIGKSVYIVKDGDVNELRKTTWLSQALDDMKNGEPVIQGGVLLGRMGTLERSVQFLDANRQFYQQYPPHAEVDYLRKGMQEWRKTVVAYHNALDECFAEVAVSVKHNALEGEAIYQQRLRALEAKYPNRAKDKGQRQAFDVEKKKCDGERDAARRTGARANARIQRGGDLRTNLDKTRNVRYFMPLSEAFADKMAIIEINNDYMTKQERLKKIDPKGYEAKRIREAMASIERDFAYMARDQEQKYGKHWKDRFRNWSTGACPGGLLKDTGADAVNVVINERASKLVETVGGLQPTTKAKEQELPKDNLTAFLTACDGKKYPDKPDVSYGLKYEKEKQSPSAEDSARIHLTKTQIYFGPIDDGAKSEWQSVEVANAGRGTLWITNISIAGPFYLRDDSDCKGKRLEEDQGCHLHFQFRPKSYTPKGDIVEYAYISYVDAAKPDTAQRASIKLSGIKKECEWQLMDERHKKLEFEHTGGAQSVKMKANRTTCGPPEILSSYWTNKGYVMDKPSWIQIAVGHWRNGEGEIKFTADKQILTSRSRRCDSLAGNVRLTVLQLGIPCRLEIEPNSHQVSGVGEFGLFSDIMVEPRDCLWRAEIVYLNDTPKGWIQVTKSEGKGVTFDVESNRTKNKRYGRILVRVQDDVGNGYYGGIDVYQDK